MPTRSGGYISRSYSIEGLSIAFSVGVLLAAMTGGGYIAAAVSLIMIVLAGDRLIAVVLCGMFAYTSFMLSGAVITPPKFATDASTGICSYIDSLPMRNTGLTKAFLQGDKTGLTKDITTAFRAAGASHLLALSGLHLGIIYAVIERPLRFLGRQEKGLLMIGATLFFTLMTGAKPSIVRAFLFIALWELAGMYGKRVTPTEVFCAALMIQVAIDPSIVWSVGFQLSYAAVGGIIIFYPSLKKWHNGGFVTNRIWNAVAIGISAQVFTAPLAWFVFHSFPQYFLLANLICIPLTTLFIVMSLISLAIGMDFAYIATDKVGDALLFTINVISSL